MMMFETSRHVPKTGKRCCVFKDKCFMWAYTEDRLVKIKINIDI